MTNRTALPVPPATMPADAVGFVAIRPDRPERLALFRPDGTLSNSFGQDEGHTEIAAILAPAGYRLLEDGSVVR